MNTAGKKQTYPSGSSKMLTSSKIQEFLRSHTVRDLIDQRLPRKLPSSIEEYKDLKTDVNQLGRELISIDHQCTVGDAIRLMKESGVTKVPVFKRVSDGGKDFFAIVTVLDLMHYLAFQDSWGRLPTDIREVDDVEEFKKKVQQNAALFDQPVGTVIGYNAESMKNVRLYVDDTAEELCRALTSVHEVLITDREHETEDIYNTLITQTDTLWYLLNNKNSMNDGTFDVSVEKVMFAMRRWQDFDPNQVIKPGVETRSHYVVKADCSFSTLVCFRMMRTHRVTSVGLVDETGKLVGNLSASDLRNIGRENFIDICLPVMEFLGKYNPSSISGAVTVRSEDSLAKAMETAIDGKIHRVYAVDENNKPVAIVTMSDMMCFTMNVVPAEE